MYAATVSAIDIDPVTNEPSYGLKFDHVWEVEVHGAVAIKRLLQHSWLKEMTLQRYMETNDVSDEEDILGAESDMIAFMAAQSQKLDAVIPTQTVMNDSKKRKPSSETNDHLFCANSTCPTRDLKRFRLYKLKDFRRREVIAKNMRWKEHMHLTHIEAQHVNL